MKMSLKEPSEESIYQPPLEGSLENVDLSRPKDDPVVQSKTSIQLPVPPPDIVNQKKHGGTRPIPSAEHLPPERNQSEISAENHSSPPSSQVNILLEYILHYQLYPISSWAPWCCPRYKNNRS